MQPGCRRPTGTEGLRRDPNESRIRNAMGLWHLRRGEFEQAAEHFQAAIARLTSLNPNPRDGEAYYNLGLAYRYQGASKDAYDAFYKATWNAAWRAPAFFALAECDATRQNWRTAVDHLQRSLRADADNLNARNLLSIVLRKLGDIAAADRALEETLALDPLDVGARWQKGITPANGQECLDLAFDLMRAGLYEEARNVLQSSRSECAGRIGAHDLVHSCLRRREARGLGRFADSRSCGEILCGLLLPESARRDDRSRMGPHENPQRHGSRPICSETCSMTSGVTRKRFFIGRTPPQKNSSFATVHRNLGIAYFNVRQDPDRALSSFEAAFAANRQDARVLYERDQLWKRTGRSPAGAARANCCDIQCSLRRAMTCPWKLATLLNQVEQAGRGAASSA